MPDEEIVTLEKMLEYLSRVRKEMKATQYVFIFTDENGQLATNSINHLGYGCCTQERINQDIFRLSYQAKKRSPRDRGWGTVRVFRNGEKIAEYS